MPGWGVSSDGREVLIVQHHRLLEIGVTGDVIMGQGRIWNSGAYGKLG